MRGRGVAVLGAFLIGVGVGYWAHRDAGSRRADGTRERADGWIRDEDPAAMGSLGIPLTDGEWWANEKGVAIFIQLEGGHGRGVLSKAGETTAFGIHLSEFEFIGAKVQFVVEHEKEVATWLGALDMGDPEAPAPTDSELEAERYEVIPMTIHDVYGRFGADMTPFKLWRKYPGGEAREVDRLRRLVTESTAGAQDR